MSEAVADHLTHGLAAMHLDIADDIQKEGATKLLQLHRLLSKWASSINLTAIHEPQAIVTRHFLDSLAILPIIKNAGKRILDLGTGAGFPGLPLALFSPQQQFVLLDGNGKKIAFIRQAIMELGLSNVVAVAKHSETYQPEEFFDAVVCRAVAALDDLQKEALHLLREGGKLFCMKAYVEEHAIKASPSYRYDKITPLTVPGLPEQRCLVQFSYRPRNP